MRTIYAAPWHRASYDKFIQESLPALLATRLPLAGYQQEEAGEFTRRVTVSLQTATGELAVRYDLPQPNCAGIFDIGKNHPFAVMPLASSAHLDIADIRCVGEQMLDHITDHLGEASANLPWDEQLLRSWCPLDAWMLEVITSQGKHNTLAATGQYLDTTNWLASQTHLRRVIVLEPEQVITPGQFGRVCPFEVPEGPNIGHVFSIALGAEIRDRKLVVNDDNPAAALGLTASTAPCLEQNDPTRQTFGVNMIRQWIPPLQREPAIVRSGNEPDVPEFWNGCNLLTAFVSWGADTYEDAILISESCAKRLSYEIPVEPGDKFSNRHGAKGVISRIVTDAEMPHLPDGTPVELVCNFLGIHARQNFGQVREALLGRIAKAEGQPIVSPPFHSPGEDELRMRLKAAGLPEDGMEMLVGKDGLPLSYRSLVGWVYWGRTIHIAAKKLHGATRPGEPTQRQGQSDYQQLRDVGAYLTINALFSTQALEHAGASTLADHVAAGAIAPADPPLPRFADLQLRLAAAGIAMKLNNDSVAFSMQAPKESLKLATPLTHPWQSDSQISEVGKYDQLSEYAQLAEANAQLARLLENHGPDVLVEKARHTLETRLADYLRALLPEPSMRDYFLDAPDPLHLAANVLFSGRSVIAPDGELHLDQVGVPEELAWQLFGPMAAREGKADDAAALDANMARSWVIVERAPTFMPTSIVAFHPVRIPGRAIRLHPLACQLMNADFDGDQVAVFLPLTEEAQLEAGKRLSIAGHVQRDPALLRWLYPNQEMLWGLAWQSLQEEGRPELCELLGECNDGLLTRDTLTAALQKLQTSAGIDAVRTAVERLMRRGFDLAKASGASISPFIGSTLKQTKQPNSDLTAEWNAYLAQVRERIEAQRDFANPDTGPQQLAVKSGARGNTGQLLRLIGPGGPMQDVNGGTIFVRHGLGEGLTPAELFAGVVESRQSLARTSLEGTRIGYHVWESTRPKGFGVLARAMRADQPGVVFAHAAASGEVDPLTDLDSRLFVGLPPKDR